MPSTRTALDPQLARRRRFEPIYSALVRKTLRVPVDVTTPGNAARVAAQLDGTLLTVGFKLSRELLEHLSRLDPLVVETIGRRLLPAVRELVGDNVRHNAYFIDFPTNVPDTLEFWVGLIKNALQDPALGTMINAQLEEGVINLLDLPGYGTYQHSYEEMLERHERLIPALKDRVTVLERGETTEDESRRLYFSLAGSGVPLGEDDLDLLRQLAEIHVVDFEQPGQIPVRENRAEINRVRLTNNMPLLVDTPVDVLRLAAAVSDGDVTLVEPTRFRSFRRAERRVLMAALDAAVNQDYKLGDVNRYREQFKRLGERLHPHEYPRYPRAQDVFAVARREMVWRSLVGRVDTLVAAGQLAEAIHTLQSAPGLLIRNVDYLMRLAAADGDARAYSEALVNAVSGAAPKTSTRVLLSLREHLLNRAERDVARVFVNRRGRAYVIPDERVPLDQNLVARIGSALDTVIRGRLPRAKWVLLDPALADVAVPLSEKSKPGGLGVLPRGSESKVESSHVRFFVYWKQRERRTDYDLSALMLDQDFGYLGHVSWTSYHGEGAVYSGDITDAPDGATEFIDVDLSRTKAHYVIPQVHVYSGESFDEVEECFFGYMERDPGQRGRPFEPRTVRMKSSLSGTGRESLPLAFARTKNGWSARWLHLTFRGHANFNRVEANRLSAGLLTRSVVSRRYLTLGYLTNLMGGGQVMTPEDVSVWTEPVLWIGLQRPDGLPEGSTVYTPANLTDLIS